MKELELNMYKEGKENIIELKLPYRIISRKKVSVYIKIKENIYI